MVQLEFEVEVGGPFENVWKYYSQFENLPDWDPNTKQVETIRKNEKEVGSVYRVVSVFNQNESVLNYQTTEFQESNERGYISLEGKNKMITAFDEIICTRKNQNSTIVKYRANISLRGVFWLFTPFIKGGLDNLAKFARDGCIKRSIEKWGRASSVINKQ